MTPCRARSVLLRRLLFASVLLHPPAKYTVSDVQPRIEEPLADARGSEAEPRPLGSGLSDYVTELLKPCTKAAVLSYRTGQAFSREADVVLFVPGGGHTIH